MTSPQFALETLLKTALLGTGRDGATPQFEGPLRPFAQGGGTAETTILNAAAAVTLGARAGQLPVQSEAPAIAPCASETQPYFSVRGASLLDLCLAEQRQLLPQALAQAAQSGRIAPPSLLPRLLEAGRASKELRGYLAPILGERGRWLAQLNPDWRQVAAPLEDDLEASWKEGEMAARREALHLQRDAEPARALEWVEAAFKSEGAKERVQWIEALEIGLSPADEPFLESALDDKSKEVRAAAVTLLQKLPDSRLVERAAAELEPLLKWKVTSRLIGLLTTRSLDVELPAAWNKAWARDGLEEKVSTYGRFRNLGEKASWVREWLARVPPSHWETAWKASPSDIVAAAPKEWRELLLGAWWEAAILHHETSWTLALIAACDSETMRQNFRFHGFTPGQADAIALALWDKSDAQFASSSPLANLLYSHPGPWSVPLARRFLKATQDEMRRDPKPLDNNGGASPGNNNQNRSNWLRATLPNLGDKFPTDLAAEATQGWPNTPEYDHWTPNITQFLARLQLRADLRTEFQKS